MNETKRKIYRCFYSFGEITPLNPLNSKKGQMAQGPKHWWLCTAVYSSRNQASGSQTVSPRGRRRDGSTLTVADQHKTGGLLGTGSLHDYFK